MRNRAPLLDLRGNTFAAKRWIPWAQRQLDRLKLLVGGNPVNRVLRPVIGTAVYVRSVEGHDFIRIHVAIVEEACNLSMILYDKGSSRLGADIILNSETGASSYLVEIDTGAPPDIHGSRLPTRYARVVINSFYLGKTRSRTITYDSPGFKEISAWSHEFIVAAADANFSVNSPTYAKQLVIGDISDATVAIYIRSENDDPVECYLNGILVGIVNSAEYGENIIMNSPVLVDPMDFSFISTLGSDIWFATLYVYEQKCVPLWSGEMTIT
jgi:hypothetical protein